MRVYFYKKDSGRSPVEEFIDSLSNEDKARFYQLITELQNCGLNAIRVIFKPIEGKLWEIKIRARGGAYRIFYVLISQDEIVLLHVFSKKSQKTPIKELKIARDRMKEVLS